jgi:EpsI family protein
VPDKSQVPLVLPHWQGQEGGLDETSLEMLRPEAYLVRNYTNVEKALINLTLIYGHSKSNIHSPALCLLGEGWNIVSKEKVSIPLETAAGGRSLAMTRMLFQKGNQKAIMLYSFLTPGKSTADWLGFQAQFLWMRLAGKQPSGALLRVIVPVSSTEAAAEKTARQFLGEIDPYLRSFLSL